MLGAIARTLMRLVVTRRNLLEWETAAEAERRAMPRGGPVRLARGCGARGVSRSRSCSLVVVVRPTALPLALPFIGLWLLAPVVADRIGRPIPPRSLHLAEADARLVRRTARKTWRFFETFVTADDNWLPPDNYQEDPRGVLARRTSPTNIGLYLLAVLAARDFGYVGLGEVAGAARGHPDTLDGLERYRATCTTGTTPPRSGRCSRSTSRRSTAATWRDTCSRWPRAARTWRGRRWWSGRGCSSRSTTRSICCARRWRGVTGTARPVASATGRSVLAVRVPAPPTDLVRMALPARGSLASARRGLAADSRSDSTTKGSGNRARRDGAQSTMLRFWAGGDRDASRIAPATRLDTPGRHGPGSLARPSDDAGGAVAARLQRRRGVPSLRDLLGPLPGAATSRRLGAVGLAPPRSGTADGAARASSVGRRARGPRRAPGALAEPGGHGSPRGPTSGSSTTRTGTCSRSASTSRPGSSTRRPTTCWPRRPRLASFVAIARGQVPQEHWFRLGRPAHPRRAGGALLSWGGTMFEYLMPLLVMRDATRETLLDETYRPSVAPPDRVRRASAASLGHLRVGLQHARPRR